MVAHILCNSLSAPCRPQLTAVDAHQRWPSDEAEAMEQDGAPLDTTRFDALCNVAADCLST